MGYTRVWTDEEVPLSQNDNRTSSSSASAAPRGRSPSVGAVRPGNTDASVKEPIEFILVGPDEMAECPFWISYYTEGTMNPRAAMAYRGSIADSLAAFSRQGIAYNDTFVTINAEVDPPHHLYMFPLARLKKQLTDPVDILLTNISSFQPTRVGLYLTDTDEKSLTAYDLYHDLVAEVLTNRHVQSLYFHSPDHGYHAVLNLISRVKHALDAKFGPIHIIH